MARDPRPVVVCLGSVVMDHTFHVDEIVQPPSKNRARSYSLGAGGLAANASIAVSQLGGNCIFWGRVGDDLNGRPLLGALAEQGVDVAQCRLAPGGPNAGLGGAGGPDWGSAASMPIAARAWAAILPGCRCTSWTARKPSCAIRAGRKARRVRWITPARAASRP
jgi:sugar/nucleoside kinase (ribokinase family)